MLMAVITAPVASITVLMAVITALMASIISTKPVITIRMNRAEEVWQKKYVIIKCLSQKGNIIRK